jgi:hypothetical protein
MIHPSRLGQIAHGAVPTSEEAISMAVALLRVVSRKIHPDTSREAAASVTKLTEKRLALLRAFDYNPRATETGISYTYEQLRQQNPQGYPLQSPSGLRARRSELVRLGLIRDSGQRTKTPYGRSAIVWQKV